MDSKEVFLKLIRIALGNESDFSMPNDVDWSEVYELSSRNGLSAICWDGVQKFDDSFLLSNEDLRYCWISQLLEIEAIYSYHSQVISILKEKLLEHGIRMLLLKGQGLAQYYPIPEHRLCGDIDIYSYGKFHEVNSIIGDLNILVNAYGHKHSVFKIGDVVVENHKYYLETYITRTERNVQKYIASIEDDILTDKGYYTPSVVKNYFFLLCHMARHFSEYESITIRHLLDWSLFLYSEKDSIDCLLIREKLREFHLERTNDLFTELSQRVSGFNLSKYIIDGISHNKVDFVLEYLLRKKIRKLPTSLLPRIKTKLNILISNKWKFEYLSITMRERIWYSIKEHISGRTKV